MRLNLLKTAPIGTIAIALSIGLHGLLLGLPLPDRSSVAEQANSEQTESEGLEPIAIRAAVPPPIQPKPAISPTPQSISPTPQPVRKTTPSPIAPRPITPPTAAKPRPQAIVPPTPQPASPPVIVPAPTPALPNSPLPTSATPKPSPSPAAFTDDFPHFANAQAGCFGLEACHQIEGEVSFRDVGRTMMEQLEAKGYRVRLRDDLEDDTGRKVYEVSKDEETQYLSVLSALELGQTVYVLAAKPMTIEELQSGSQAVPEG